MNKLFAFVFCIVLGMLALGFKIYQNSSVTPSKPIAYALRQNLLVEIQTVGELEAAHSTSIASMVRGDQGKIIAIAADGASVYPGDVLVRLDPTPFEEKCEKLRLQVNEQEAHIASIDQALDWETLQAYHKNQAAQLEIEGAKLELERVRHGEGPQEILRLKSAMQKALQAYEEQASYAGDLAELESQGFLNPAEMRQAEKKKQEEWESYQLALQQYESYVQHVFPMQIKKGETLLKRHCISQEESYRSGLYAIAKTKAALEQAKQVLSDDLRQLREAENELISTVIKAPTAGMVVLREEYRASQKRKPRVGDVLVRNQPLIDLPDLSTMIVKTKVREVDLFKVDVGKEARVEVDAYPHLSFSGRVASIGVLAIADIDFLNEEKYFEVRIILDNGDARLRPGMTARSTICSQIMHHVVTIPIYSVFEENHVTYCYVYGPPNTCEKRKIVLGISNEQWVEVKEGVCEGECISLLKL